MTYDEWLALQNQQKGFPIGGEQQAPMGIAPDFKKLAAEQAMKMIAEPAQQESPMLPFGMALMSLGQQMQVPPYQRNQNNNLQSIANSLLAYQMGQQQRTTNADAKKVAALSTLEKLQQGEEKPIVVEGALVNPKTGQVIYQGMPKSVNWQSFDRINPDGTKSRLAWNPQTNETRSIPDTESLAYEPKPFVPKEGNGPIAWVVPGQQPPENYIAQTEHQQLIRYPEMPESAVDFYAKGLLRTGEVPKGGGIGMAKNLNQIYARAADIATAHGIDPAEIITNRENFKGYAKSFQDLQKLQSRVVSALNTANQHLDQALEISKEVGNTGVPLINRWINAGKREITGDPAISKFDATIRIAGTEISKALQNMQGQLSDTARKEIDELLNARQTPEQFLGTIQTLRGLMDARNKSFDEEKSKMTNLMKSIGTSSQFQSMENPIPQTVSPQMQKSFPRTLRNKKTGQTVTVNSQEELDKLMGNR